MQKLSIGAAWAQSVAFVKGYTAPLAIVLIAVGVAAPLLIQFLLVGSAAFSLDAADMAQQGAAAVGLTAIASIIGYVLQTGSYFAAWRVGFSAGQESLGAAIGYGMIASLPAMLVLVGVALLVSLLAVAVIAMFGGAVGLTDIMNGNLSPAAGAAAGIGIIFLVLALFAVMLWLTARLICTGPAMAARRSFNPLNGLAESWRITRAGQWRILGYLLLLALAIMVLSALVGGTLIGAMMTGGGSIPLGGIFLILASLVTGIPLAFLYAAVPYGLYRELALEDRSDIFA